MTTGIVGLGAMGYGMATSLLRSSADVYGFDLNEESVARFVAAGGKTGHVKDIAKSLDTLVLVVLNAAQTQSVVADIVPSMAQGSVVIACATVPPTFAQEMEAICQSAGVHYLDAPISGGAVKAAAGKLSVMASGTPAAFDAATPALDAMAEKVFTLGDKAGPGSAMKAINQLLAGVHIASMAEALTFGIKLGVDPAQTLDVISQCAGTSWMFENRAPHVVDADYTPRSAIDIWPKDLGIVLDIAESTQFSAPLTRTALEQFRAAADMGLGSEDDAALVKLYAHESNIELPQ